MVSGDTSPVFQKITFPRWKQAMSNHVLPRDLSGLPFGRLTVVRLAVPFSKDPETGKQTQSKWLCRCKCGNELEVLRGSLVSGNTNSCGCLRRDVSTKRATKHGLSRSPERDIWAAMVARCHRKSCKEYKWYGARGISVCQRWRDSFERFYRDVGPRPSRRYTLERRENDRGYEPGNVRWATRREQARNTRRNVWLELDGRRMVLEDWAAEIGCNPQTIRDRMDKGWSDDKVLGTPIKRRPTQST